MAGYTKEYLAQEAERLLKDPVLNEALAQLKAEALDDLSRVDPEQTAQIIGYQQKALMADEILEQLNRFILALPTE